METNETTFKFIRFNPRRAMRGAEAAELEIFENGESLGYFWMNAKNIKENLKTFGECPALLEGLSHYEWKKDDDTPKEKESRLIKLCSEGIHYSPMGYIITNEKNTPFYIHMFTV